MHVWATPVARRRVGDVRRERGRDSLAWEDGEEEEKVIKEAHGWVSRRGKCCG